MRRGRAIIIIDKEQLPEQSTGSSRENKLKCLDQDGQDNRIGRISLIA